MRRTRNHDVIYTGLVGSRLRIRKRAVQRRIFYKHVRCFGGPLDGATIQLDRNGDMRTLPIVLRGQAGYYKAGSWNPLFELTERADRRQVTG